MLARVETEPRSILKLAEYIELLTPPQREVFGNIFEIDEVAFPLNFPSNKARQYLAGRFKVDPELVSQRHAVRVTNLVWGEETLFNPLRASRPLQSGSTEQSKEAMKILERNNPEGEACDFCVFTERTPSDPFGNIEGKFSVSRANVAGYDGIHGLIIPKDHHPANFSEEVIHDMVWVAREWVTQAQRYAQSLGISNTDYPFIMMNNLPRAGASVFHPHMQVLLAKDKPYMKGKILRDRAGDYQWLNKGRSYFADLIECLEPLGLVGQTEGARVIFNPVPIKEGEVLVVADDLDGMPNGNLSRAITRVVSWWREIGITSFDLAIYMPRLGQDLSSSGDWYQFKPFARMVNRGPEGNGVSDIGAMELYAASVVSYDPFQSAQLFAGYLKKRAAA